MRFRKFAEVCGRSAGWRERRLLIPQFLLRVILESRQPVPVEPAPRHWFSSRKSGLSPARGG